MLFRNTLELTRLKAAVAQAIEQKSIALIHKNKLSVAASFLELANEKLAQILQYTPELIQ